MGRKLLLFWSVVHLLQCEPSVGEFSEGLDNCYNVSMGVRQGCSRSLHLSLNSNWQKLVKKYDPKTKTWKDEMLAVYNSVDKTTSVSLINGNFTVWNAEKSEEGLYKIERYLDNSCLVVVNVTVLDPPLPKTARPSFDVSSVVTSKVTEAPNASPPGINYTYILVGVFVLLDIIFP